MRTGKKMFQGSKAAGEEEQRCGGSGCVRDNSGKIVVEEDRLLEVWKEHYDRISNEEFSWDREGLTDVRPVYRGLVRKSLKRKLRLLLVR